MKYEIVDFDTQFDYDKYQPVIADIRRLKAGKAVRVEIPSSKNKNSYRTNFLVKLRREIKVKGYRVASSIQDGYLYLWLAKEGR